MPTDQQSHARTPERPDALPEALYRKAYRLLADVAPLASDCGELCGKACCRGVEEGAGMYLFPGEECMFSGDEDWLAFERREVTADDQAFCPEWLGKIQTVTLAVCRGSCPRDRRPLACRVFPLAARIIPTNGPLRLGLTLDPDAAMLCPLARYARLTQLRTEFRAACLQVFRLLSGDPLILADFAWRDARRREGQRDGWLKLLEP